MNLGELIKRNRLSDAMHYDLCFSCDDKELLFDLVDVDDKNQKINIKLFQERKKNLDVKDIFRLLGVFSSIDEIVSLCGNANLMVNIHWGEDDDERFIVLSGENKDAGISNITHKFAIKADLVDEAKQVIDEYIFKIFHSSKTKHRKKINEKLVKLANEGFDSGDITTKISVKIPYSGVSDKIRYYLEYENQKWEMNEETYKAIVESFKKADAKTDLSIQEQNKILINAFTEIGVKCFNIDYLYLPENVVTIINKIISRGGLIDSWEVKAGIDPLYDENGKPLMFKTKWFGYKLTDVELNMLGKQTLYEIYKQLKPLNSNKINAGKKEKKIIFSIVGKDGIIPQTFKKLGLKYE